MDNQAIFFLIYNLSHQSHFLDSLMVFGAKYLIFLTVFLMGIFIFKGGVGEKKAAVLSIGSFALAFFLETIIHLLFYLPRPFIAYQISPLINHDNSSSFPSTHTAAMAAIAFSYYFYKSRLAPIFLFLMIWVGLARVLVGVHFPLDILGGIALGFISTSLAWQFKSWLKRKVANF